MPRKLWVALALLSLNPVSAAVHQSWLAASIWALIVALFALGVLKGNNVVRWTLIALSGLLFAFGALAVAIIGLLGGVAVAGGGAFLTKAWGALSSDPWKTAVGLSLGVGVPSYLPWCLCHPDSWRWMRRRSPGSRRSPGKEPNAAEA